MRLTHWRLPRLARRDAEVDRRLGFVPCTGDDGEDEDEAENYRKSKFSFYEAGF